MDAKIMKYLLLPIFLFSLLYCNLSNAQSSILSDLFGVPITSYAGLQVGITGFYGDLRNSHWMAGDNTIKGEFMTDIGQDKTFGGKLSVMFGQFSQKTSGLSHTGAVEANSELYPQEMHPLRYVLGGYEEGNLNFRTRFFEIGLQGEYRLNHLSIFRTIYPFFSTGVNLIIYNPYADRSKLNYDGNPVLYETLRLGGTLEDMQRNQPVCDGDYETQLKTAQLYGAKIKGVTVGFPLEIGFDLRVLPMVHIRCGTSFTFTCSDNIDGVAGKVARAARATQETALAENAAHYWATATDAQQRAARLPTNRANDFYSHTYVACYIKLPL
ncbi:MAG: hypothetical protein ACRC9X_03000 [Bacteroidales bacterium]